MNYTENLSLGLPEYGEDADVADLNRNSGILDAYCYNTRQIECKPYDSTKTYMSGDLSIHNEVVYECNTDNTTGTWDDSKWDSTTLAEQIAKAKQSGGESALADLEDVEITNPSTGQALLFDDDDDKWKNQDLPDVSVTKTASGNPIEITDGTDAPLVKCTTAITGSQDLHGYDKPWVGGAGKNKLPLTVSGIKANNTSGTWSGNAYTINDITFTIETDGDGNVTDIKVNGTASSNADLQIGGYFGGTTLFAQSGSYTTSINNTVFSMIVGYGNNVVIRTSDSDTQTFSDGISWAILRVLSGTTVNNQIATPMIRLATVSDSTFEPYSNICPITAYTEGKIEVRGKNLFDKNGTLNTGYLQEDGSISGNSGYRYTDYISIISNEQYYFYLMQGTNPAICWYDEHKNFISGIKNNGAQLLTLHAPANAKYVRASILKENVDTFTIKKVDGYPTYEPYVGTTHTATFSQSIYQGNADFVGSKATATWGYIASYNGETLPGEWISSMDEYAPGTTPTTGAQVAYELASPTEETITPSNLPLKSLFGYNHIESSTGDMEIEYITENYQPLVDLIQSSNGHTYSTQEQVVGKWIDGSTLYEKTFYKSSVSSASSSTILIPASELGEINVVGMDGRYIIGGNNMPININLNGTSIIATWLAGGNVYYWLIWGSVTSGDVYLTIRYTKPTQTRSLSAPVTSQKAQIEPLTEKEEEVPTEEEKAVNEEENNDER